MRPHITATALPAAILPQANDVFALRASLAAVSAAAAASKQRIERTKSSGRCTMLALLAA